MRDCARTEPVYCCAILRDDAGRHLMELRPATDIDCPGRLTCFGGARHAGELPLECLRRELREELGFQAVLSPSLLPSITLHTPAGQAWFYLVDPPRDVRAREPGHEAVWIEGDPAKHPAISEWHRAALEALGAGRDKAFVGPPPASGP